MFECPHTENVINADLNGAINMMKHSPMRIGVSGLRHSLWSTVGAGWVTTSNEVMRMKAVNHEPMISLEGTTFPLGL